MSRFFILAITLTMAIIFTGAGLGWYIYQNIIQSPEISNQTPPQTASTKTVIEVYKDDRDEKTKAVRNNAFQEIPPETEN